jgi:hypothetical protein
VHYWLKRLHVLQSRWSVDWIQSSSQHAAKTVAHASLGGHEHSATTEKGVHVISYMLCSMLLMTATSVSSVTVGEVWLSCRGTVANYPGQSIESSQKWEETFVFNAASNKLATYDPASPTIREVMTPMIYASEIKWSNLYADGNRRDNQLDRRTLAYSWTTYTAHGDIRADATLKCAMVSPMPVLQPKF